VDQQKPSSTATHIQSSMPSRAPHAGQLLDNDEGGEFVNAHFRPEALKRFNQFFTPTEQPHVLAMLVEQVEAAITIEEGAGAPLKQLTILSIHFRFVDLRLAGCILIESLHRDGDDPPPTKRHAIRDAMISGGVLELIRWVLGQIFGKVLWGEGFVFPAMIDIPESSERDCGGQLLGLPSPSRLPSGADTQCGSRLYPWTNFVSVGVSVPTCDVTSWRLLMSARTTAMSRNRIEFTLKTLTTVIDGEVVTTFQVPISRTVDVKSIRMKLEMTQEMFAKTFGLSLASLRNWEQGTRVPERPIALYLRLIDKYPEEVRREVEAMRLASSGNA
jgi:putative transcriptional regulator